MRSLSRDGAATREMWDSFVTLVVCPLGFEEIELSDGFDASGEVLVKRFAEDERDDGAGDTVDDRGFVVSAMVNEHKLW